MCAVDAAVDLFVSDSKACDLFLTIKLYLSEGTIRFLGEFFKTLTDSIGYYI